MPSVAPAFRYGPILALFLPLILAGSLAGMGMAAPNAAEPVIIISRSDCSQLANHYLAHDVSAMFDEDASGHALVAGVSPAARRLAMVEDIAIDITSELQQRLGLSDESILIQPEAGVGNVVVKPDSSAAINGQILSDAEAYALVALCRDPGQAVP